MDDFFQKWRQMTSSIDVFPPESDWVLLLIKQCSEVCQLAGLHTVYSVDKIVVLPLNTTDSATDLDLDVGKILPI